MISRRSSAHRAASNGGGGVPINAVESGQRLTRNRQTDDAVGGDAIGHEPAACHVGHELAQIRDPGRVPPEGRADRLMHRREPAIQQA